MKHVGNISPMPVTNAKLAALGGMLPNSAYEAATAVAMKTRQWVFHKLRLHMRQYQCQTSLRRDE